QPVPLGLRLTVCAGHLRNRFQLDRTCGTAAYRKSLHLSNHLHIAVAALQALSNRFGELARAHVRSGRTLRTNDHTVRYGSPGNTGGGRDSSGGLPVLDYLPIFWTSDSQTSKVRYLEVRTRLHRRDRDGRHAFLACRCSRGCGDVENCASFLL